MLLEAECTLLYYCLKATVRVSWYACVCVWDKQWTLMIMWVYQSKLTIQIGIGNSLTKYISHGIIGMKFTPDLSNNVSGPHLWRYQNICVSLKFCSQVEWHRKKVFSKLTKFSIILCGETCHQNFSVLTLTQSFTETIIQILKVLGPHLCPLIVSSLYPILSCIGFKLSVCLGHSSKCFFLSLKPIEF